MLAGWHAAYGRFWKAALLGALPQVGQGWSRGDLPWSEAQIRLGAIALKSANWPSNTKASFACNTKSAEGYTTTSVLRLTTTTWMVLLSWLITCLIAYHWLC